jgi:hypothetical protein
MWPFGVTGRSRFYYTTSGVFLTVLPLKLFGTTRLSRGFRETTTGRRSLNAARVVGQLMEEEFNRLGIRYIAITDNINAAKGIRDLVPMQDPFNERHAKSTSQKVRSMMFNGSLVRELHLMATQNPPGWVRRFTCDSNRARARDTM